MLLTNEEWNRVEQILKTVLDLDHPNSRKTFALKIIGSEPLRRSYYASLVATPGLNDFSTQWNSAIRTIDDPEICYRYAQTLWEYVIDKREKDWLAALAQRLKVQLNQGENLQVGEPLPGLPANAPELVANPAIPGAQRPATLPPVRFRIREIAGTPRSQSNAATPCRMELIREDSSANQATLTLGEVSVTPLKLTEETALSNYFGERNSISGIEAHHTEELMVEIGRRLFQEAFKAVDAQTELHTHRQSNRKLEFIIEGSFKIHRMPWELMRYVTNDRRFDLPFVHEYPIFREVTAPARFQPLHPLPTNHLRILWISARHPQDDIARDAVYSPVKTALEGLPVSIDFIQSGSLLELNEKLAEHTENPKYHVLHLDMHGEVTSASSLRNAVGQSDKWCLDYRPGGLGSVPDSGTSRYEEETTYLWFNHNEKVMPVSALEIASKIAIRGVPLVVLNACESARVPYSDASLVASLVQAGGFPAVGFQQPTTVAAAVQFFQVFYKQLVQDREPSSLRRATHKGRMVLLNDAYRGNVPFIDWWLPALYDLPR